MPLNRISIALAAALAVGRAAPCCAAGPQKITFATSWLPQAQFAGYYMALEKGFYARQGLDVEIIDGGPQKSPAARLRSGKADFALMWFSQGMELNASGAHVVNFFQAVQKPGLLLVARRSSGIAVPADLSGKKIAVWPDMAAPVKAFLASRGIAVRLVEQGASVNLLLRGGADAVSAMDYNEYRSLIMAGLEENELVTFKLSDYGAAFPEDGLYALAGFFGRNRQAACGFAKASLEGWRYAFGHQDEAVDTVMARCRAEKAICSAVNQRWMLERMRSAVLPPGAVPGLLPRADYEAAAAMLARYGLRGAVPDWEAFFRGCDDGK